MEKIKLSKLIEIKNINELNSFLSNEMNILFKEKISEEEFLKNWNFVGNNISNYSIVNMVSSPEKGIIERLTNAVDAVIEKNVIKSKLEEKVNSVEEVIKYCYPKLDESRMKVLFRKLNKNNMQGIDDVILIINDSSIFRRPTFDIIDKGIGILGRDFKKTILSLNAGNKISSNKKYLIGTFGQGGSTSLAFSKATIIISKKENKFYFTIIREFKLSNLKTPVYGYLCTKTPEHIYELENDFIKNKHSYLDNFVDTESGTLIKMIETEIDYSLIQNDVSKPGSLCDYINTEFYKPPLPIKVIENRDQFLVNKHVQNRYSSGTFWKLLTSKYNKKEFSGEFLIDFNNKKHDIHYYIILPIDELKWSSEIECKDIFKTFNTHLDPIIYVVNGQTIATEGFTKLRNRGLNFLKYRLLVEVNLDNLGDEKYNYFTTDRAKMKQNEIAKKLIDNIIDNLVNIKELKKLNDIIADKVVSSSVSGEDLKKISLEVKDIYKKFISKKNSKISYTTENKDGFSFKNESNKNFLDEIQEIKVTTARGKIFYKNEKIQIYLETNAYKNVNAKQKVSVFINEKEFFKYNPNFMNGRILYVIEPNILSVGKHSIEFYIFKDNNPLKDKSSFEIINEDLSQIENNIIEKDLNLLIRVINEAELMCDIRKDKVEKTIEILVCFDNQQFHNFVLIKKWSNERIDEFKTKIMKNIALYVLLLENQYEKIESIAEKNNLIMSYIKSFSFDD